ncbi:MAG: hypothetical protein JNL14_14235 [Devosia sp.]|jgi:hypothetical protein|uniref:hypothetical protein n=1 Tax=Devosia sp. TaxID=1871048 RepID=UPI001A4781BB|nr:hypothetical protein [Devosia sp.]MBL8598889.1 hypothetical protein [Devosia sp.]
MRQLVHSIAAFAVALLMLGGQAAAAEPEVRVIVPEVPGGVIVSNCYRAVGRIYDGYTFSFCLKQRATYSVRGNGVRCEGRLNWDVEGIFVHAKLRRTSCGNGVAWSADTMVCRPSLLLSIISNLLGQDRPLLDTLRCDYTPAKGTGEKKITFVAQRY